MQEFNKKEKKKEHCYYFSKVIKQAQILNEILTFKKNKKNHKMAYLCFNLKKNP